MKDYITKIICMHCHEVYTNNGNLAPKTCSCGCQRFRSEYEPMEIEDLPKIEPVFERARIKSEKVKPSAIDNLREMIPSD